jgi:pimeloyl-ACP methyl ester carboxylesterase
MPNPLIAARDAFARQCPERRVNLRGRDWGVLDTETGDRTLVLIPGTLGRGDIFWQQITALRDRVRLIALTYPSSGGIDDLSGDVLALLDRAEIDTANVLGSSLGGYLAQYFAARNPDRTTGLIAANTLSSVDGIAVQMPYALDLDAVPIDDLRAGFHKGLGAWQEAHPEQSDLVALLLAEVGGRIPEPELRNRLKALKFAPSLPSQTLDQARIVTIESDDDPLIRPEMRSAVRARLSPGVAYRFARGGHFPYVARPEAYTALLEQVLGLDRTTGPDWGTGPERTL